jgi:hypothetical protein
MLEARTLSRSPLNFLPNDSVSIEGMLVRVDRVEALTANLVRVEGNVMSFPVSMVLGATQIMKVTRMVHML